MAMFHLDRARRTIGVRLSSDLVLVENFLQMLAHILIQEQVSNPYPVLAVARELLENAVLHGNKADPSTKVTGRVERLRGQRWRIEVADEGAGFDHSRLAAGAVGSSGYPLVRSLADRLSWSHGGSRVTAELSCAQDGHPGADPPPPVSANAARNRRR